MPKSHRNATDKTKQRKMDVRERKIKKLAVLHPLSRKAAKEHKNLIHIDSVDRHIKAVDAKHKPEVQKHHWFQKAVWMDEKSVYTKDELRELAFEYISRNDEEIHEAQMSCVAGASSIRRLAPTSEGGKMLAARINDQVLLQRGAYMVPDLTSKKNVLAVKNWRTGNVDQMNNIRKVSAASTEEVAASVAAGSFDLFYL